MKPLIMKLMLVTASVLAILCSNDSCADDLKQCYSRALEQDPQLRGAHYRTLAADETVSQAWSKFFPSVSFDVDLTQYFQNIVESKNSVMPSGSTDFLTQSYTAQLLQPLLHFDYFAQLSLAETTKTRVDHEMEAARQDMMIRVTESYLGVLAAKDNLKYLQAEASALQMHYDFADGRYKMGLVPLTDLEDALAKLAAIKADEVEAVRVHDNAIQVLREVIGSSVTEVKALKESVSFQLPIPDDVEKWLAGGMQNNAALKAKRSEAEEANIEIDRQKAGHYPYVDLQSRWNRKDSGGSIYGGGSVVDTVDVGVKMTIPIFSGGLINSKVRESTANHQKLLQEVIRLERQVARQVRDAFYGMKSSISRVGAFRKSVDSQSLVLEAKEYGLRSGLYSILDVLDAAKDLNLYQRNLSKSKYDYILSFIKLKQAAGTLAENDISEINGWLN